MADPLLALEADVRAAGHELVRDYLMGDQGTFDGGGWVIQVDGEVVAHGASVGALLGG